MTLARLGVTVTVRDDIPVGAKALYLPPLDAPPPSRRDRRMRWPFNRAVEDATRDANGHALPGTGRAAADEARIEAARAKRERKAKKRTRRLTGEVVTDE